MGTLRYRAREIYTSEEENQRPDGKVDMYSFGLLAWALLAGAHPYHFIADVDEGMIRDRVLKGDTPTVPPNYYKENRPRALWDFIQLCWSEDLEDRPYAADAVIILKQILSLIEEDKPVGCFPWQDRRSI